MVTPPRRWPRGLGCALALVGCTEPPCCAADAATAADTATAADIAAARDLGAPTDLGTPTAVFGAGFTDLTPDIE